MFGLGVGEVFMVLLLALLVLGPQKLPEVAKQLARFAGELRRVADEVRRQFDEDSSADQAPARPVKPPAAQAAALPAVSERSAAPVHAAGSTAPAHSAGLVPSAHPAGCIAPEGTVSRQATDDAPSAPLTPPRREPADP
jgi:Tat protein translocase TatB subunit